MNTSPNQNEASREYSIMKRNPPTPLDIYRDRLKLILIVFFIYLLFNLFHIGCPIKFSTGFSCPGCGMTRAVLSAMMLRFKEAFYYHPLFWLAPAIPLLFLLEGYLKKSHVKLAWSLIIISFFIVYIIRLFFTASDVVEIDISEGLVLKLIHHIIVGGNK